LILIAQPKLRFLLAGREITTTLTKDKREWRKGRHYAVGVRHNRTICRVILVKVTDIGDELELTIRLADVEAPRLLGRTGGYVTDPALALRDEPEAVDVRSQERFTAAARERAREHGKDPDRALRDGLLRELEAWEALTGGVTDRERADTIRGIRRQIAALDRKLKAA
jgi:hypothetical protein